MSDEDDSFFWDLKYVAPFGLFISFLYNIGYWRRFEINVYQYAGLSDLVSSTVLPLTYSLIFVAVSFFYKNKIESKYFSSFTWKSGTIYYSYLFIMLCLVLYLMSIESKWYWVALFFGTLTKGYNDENLDKRDAEIKERKQFLVRLLVLLSFTSYTVGIDRANDIKTGFEYLSPDKADDSLRFIGKAGAHYFFYDPISSGVKYESIDKHKEMMLYPCYAESCNHNYKNLRSCLNPNEKQNILTYPAIKFGWKEFCPEPEPEKVDAN
jgi:hypothetical protein